MMDDRELKKIDRNAQWLVKNYNMDSVIQKTFYIQMLKYSVGCEKCNSTKIIRLKTPFKSKKDQKKYYYICKNCKIPVDIVAVRVK